MQCSVPFLASLFCLWVIPAHADYRLCNRTAYVLDAALAIEIKGATATKGWFRVVPGGCRVLLTGEVAGDRFFLHAATPPGYGERPEPPAVSRMLCVENADFLKSGAETCNVPGGRLAPFTEVTADVAGGGETRLSGALDMDADAARHAGLVHLLRAAGYDAGAPAGTGGALAAFRKDAGLGAGADDGALFSALLEAAARGRKTGNVR